MSRQQPLVLSAIAICPQLQCLIHPSWPTLCCNRRLRPLRTDPTVRSLDHGKGLCTSSRTIVSAWDFATDLVANCAPLWLVLVFLVQCYLCWLYSAHRRNQAAVPGLWSHLRQHWGSYRPARQHSSHWTSLCYTVRAELSSEVGSPSSLVLIDLLTMHLVSYYNLWILLA